MFEKYTRSQSLCTSRIDFLHQQLMSPSLLPTPRVVDRSPKFLWADNGDVASWLKAEDQEGSFPRWKKEMKVARRSLTNFCAVVVPRRQHNLPLDGKPDLFSVFLLSTILLFLPVFSKFLPPIFCTLWVSPLFGLDAQAVLFLSALRAGPPSRHAFWLIEPHNAHHQNQRN